MKINYKGFTLAEIIIAMSIIGIIAAMTIPALLTSTNEKTLEAKNKALYARISQAMSQIEDLRVYKSTKDDGSDASSTIKFINKGLSKVYRITHTCDKETLIKGCNFPESIYTPNGSKFEILSNKTLMTLLDNPTNGGSLALKNLDTDVAGVKTANGESIAIYYNPNCRGSKTKGFYEGNIASAMCINMIYDLNGATDPPNQVGKDIGILTVFFPKDPDIAAPALYGADAEDSSITLSGYENAIKLCKKQNKSLIVPNWLEGMSIALNKKITNVDSNGEYLVSGPGSASSVYISNVQKLLSTTSTDWSDIKLRCIYNK